MSTVQVEISNYYDASRNSTSFYPSVWGNYFLTYASQSLDIDVETEKKGSNLEEEAKKMFARIENDHPQKLKLIDTIQLLGLSHHFETEIAHDLSIIHKANVVSNSDGLFLVSLSFRLLRQGGYNISNDVLEDYLKTASISAGYLKTASVSNFQWRDLKHIWAYLYFLLLKTNRVYNLELIFYVLES